MYQIRLQKLPLLPITPSWIKQMCNTPIGPYDDYALARAVELKEQSAGTLTVLNVGEAETEPTLRKALAHRGRRGNSHPCLP